MIRPTTCMLVCGAVWAGGPLHAAQGLKVTPRLDRAVRKGLDEPVPGLTILRWYRELGGELLVIGSDGHMPQDIAHSFDLARELAKAAGFHRVPRYAHREVVDWIAL